MERNVKRLVLSPRSVSKPIGFGTVKHVPPPRSRIANWCLFLACVPVLVFLSSQTYQVKERSLHVYFPCEPFNYCPNGPHFVPQFESVLDEDVNDQDAILSVDLLNNWHWCPSALKRMRDLDPLVNEFLVKARRRGALVIHAVSDSKPHYLNEPGIRKAARTKASLHVPEGPGHDWTSLNKYMLRSFNPPPPTSLSLDRACGNEGRALFGAPKPKTMHGLNETNINPNYDIVAIDQDVIYSEIKTREKPIKRILFVGVHLDLCILYSRWFSLLRIAKFWQLDDDVSFGIVAPLTDMSNSKPDVHYSLQMERDDVAVERLACWISCVAGPSFLGQEKSKIALYDFRF